VIRLDEQLEELAGNVVRGIGFDPPELRDKLLPPQLRVLKGVPHGLNNYCVPQRDGTKLILVGEGLYSFFGDYTRAAAAYFLPSEPGGGRRPSEFWPGACSALATTLDWIASPAPEPHRAEFPVSAYQERIAEAFQAYTYRFALCHEMAHVALEHVDGSPTELRRAASGEVEVLQASQEQEAEADRFGLHLQVKSLDRSQHESALASAVYFIHVTGLLDLRLMLLAHLVDANTWNIAYTHPPALQRVLNLMGAAEALGRGQGAVLQREAANLGGLDAELRECARKQQDEVATEVLPLLKNEATAATSTELLRLFERSPLGVLRGLEPSPGGAASEQLAAALPMEFQEFRRKTREQRARQLA
jgi:hypothetical protein